MQWVALAGWLVALGIGLAWFFVQRRLITRALISLRKEYENTVAILNRKIDKLQGQKK